MKCRYPIQINCKGRQIYVPCGHCAWCLAALRDEWIYRMKQEAKAHIYNYFLTFTYRDEDLPYNLNEDTGEIVATVCKDHVSQFNRKLRKSGHRFKFLVCSEYGPQTLRPHYHGVWFCDDPFDFEKEWPYGDNNVQLPANEGSYKYILKYMLKGSVVPDGAQPNFRLMSRRPGIGSNIQDSVSVVLDREDHYLLDGGIKRSIPRYYKKGYYKSLAPNIVEIAQEKRLDYLADVIRHGELIRKWEKSGSNIPFEKWLDFSYRKDFLAQIKINKNEKENGYF